MPSARVSTGTSWSGPKSATRVSASRPSSAIAFSASASTRMRCSVRAISSRCTASTSDSKSAARVRTAARAAVRAASASAGRPRPRSARRPPGPASARPGRQVARAAVHRRGDLSASRSQPLAAGQGLGPGLPLALGRPPQGVGPTGQSPGPLLQRAQRQPGVHLGRRGPAGPPRPAGPGRPGRARPRRRSRGQLEPVLEVGQSGEVAVPGLPRPGRSPAAAVRPRSCAERAVELSCPSSSASAAIAASDSCSRARATSTASSGLAVPLVELALGEPQPLAGVAGLAPAAVSASSIAACTSIRLGWADDPPAAKWAPSTSPSRVTATRSGSAATSAAAAGRSSTTATRRSTRCTAAASSAGASTTSTRVDRTGRAAPASRLVVGSAGSAPPSSRPARPRSSALRWSKAPTRGVQVGDRDGVRGRPEGGGDRGLVAGSAR